MSGASFADFVGSSHFVVEGSRVFVAFGFASAYVAVVAQIFSGAVCPAVGDGFVGCVVALANLWSLGCTAVVVVISVFVVVVVVA